MRIRDARPGDGEALAVIWLEEGRYYDSSPTELVVIGPARAHRIEMVPGKDVLERMPQDITGGAHTV